MPLTRCFCELRDCAFWNAPKPPVQGGDCDCAHPEKHHYMRQPCPLYRKNWAAAASKADELKKKFFGKKQP